MTGRGPQGPHGLGRPGEGKGRLGERPSRLRSTAVGAASARPSGTGPASADTERRCAKRAPAPAGAGIQPECAQATSEWLPEVKHLQAEPRVRVHQASRERENPQGIHKHGLVNVLTTDEELAYETMEAERSQDLPWARWRLGKPGVVGSSLKAAGFDQERLMFRCESRGRKAIKPLRQEYSPSATRGSAFCAV